MGLVMKLTARIFFCLIPSLFLSAPFFALHPVIGFVALVVFFGLGLDLTEAKPERGENE